MTTSDIRRRDLFVYSAAASSLAALGALVPATSAHGAGLYLEWPFPRSTLNSYESGGRFGDRRWTGWPYHNGVDFGIRAGTPVYACGDGKITASRDMGQKDGRGRYVQIQHVDGTRTGYAHLNTLEFAGAGATVKRGTLLGTVGDTWGYAPHFHWEIWSGGVRVDPVAFMESRSFNNVVQQGQAGEYLAGPDWSISLTNADELQGKSALYSPVITLASIAKSVSISRNCIGIVDRYGSARIKTPSLDSAWISLIGASKSIAVDGERFVVLREDGTVNAKEGVYSKTWTTQIGGVTKIAASNGRIGVLQDGALYVKEGTLYDSWTMQAGDVTDFALDGNRIGIVGTNGTASVKEGTLWAPWVTMAGAERIALAGARIALLSGGTLRIKEGNLWSSWTTVATGVSDFCVTPTRVGIVQAGAGRLQSGALTNGFVGAFANSKKILLS